MRAGRDHRDDPARGGIGWQALLSGGLTATDSLVCGMAEPEPGQDFARHRHKEPEVSFGLAGGGMVMVDGA